MAHSGVEDNKKADEEVKRAAVGNFTPPKHLPHIFRSPLLPSVGATKHHFLSTLPEEWSEDWQLSQIKASLERLDKDLPFEKHYKLVDQLKHIQRSMIFQLWLNHMLLNTRSANYHLTNVSSAGKDAKWKPEKQ